MNKKSFAGRIFSPITAIVLVVLLVAANIGVAYIPSRYRQVNVGMHDIYDISDESRSFLSRLDEDIRVFVISNGSVDTQFELFMERYCETSERIELYFMSAQQSADLLEKYGYSIDSLGTYSVLVASQKRQKIIDYSSMFYYYNSSIGKMTYSQYAQLYAYYSSYAGYEEYLGQLVYNTKRYFSGDAVMSGLVEYVSLDILPVTYLLSGHGEDSATDGKLASFLGELGYAYEELAGAEVIPEDAGCIVINAPASDISASEKEQLLLYLEDGGRLLLTTAEKNLEHPNLMSVMEYYGGVAESGIILDDTGEASEGGEAGVISPSINSDSDIFASLSEYEFKLKRANGITFSNVLRPSQIVTALLTSSDTSYVDGDDQRGKRTVALSVEEENENGTARIVWFTGAESFSDDEYYKESLPLLIFSLAWLEKGYESEIGEISAVLYDTGVLYVSEIMLWCFGILVLSLPILSAVYGAYVIKKRKNRS